MKRGKPELVLKSLTRLLSGFLPWYLGLAVLYGNVAVMLNQSPLGVNLPTLSLGVDMFNLFAVFHRGDERNTTLFIRGQVAPTAPCQQAGLWQTLPVADYFPHARGEQLLRLWPDPIRLKKRTHFYEHVARNIQNQYNRRHPTCPLSAIQLGLESWPRSKHGYHTLHRPAHTQRQLWYPQEAVP